jgi:hypothetical protein
MKVRTHIKAGKGMGDVIADFTHAAKLDRFAENYQDVTGKCCNCGKRRKLLNEMFPDIPFA